MAEKKPLLVIFAGPNGSGKSTITEQYFQDITELPYINADVIAKKKGINSNRGGKAKNRSNSKQTIIYYGDSAFDTRED